MRTLISAAVISLACALTAQPAGFESAAGAGVKTDFKIPKAQAGLAKKAPAQDVTGSLAISRLNDTATSVIEQGAVSCARPDRQKIRYLMRSPDTGETLDISPKLMRLLCLIDAHFGGQGIMLIYAGGYRGPAQNALNIAKAASLGGGVASNSLHMYGMAADIRVPGRSFREVGEFAQSLKIGGVGYYPISSFTHVDVGRVRIWRGS